MQEAIEKFAIFGGVKWDKIDTSKEDIELIKTLILPDYRYIRNDITELTDGLPLYHSILTAIAQGDAKSSTTFKRAKVSQEVGMNALEKLCEIGVIKKQKAKVSNTPAKYLFTSPFLRFWFAFVSPIFKGVRDGDYSEIETLYSNKKEEFVQLIFRELSFELLKNLYKNEDPIVEISSYWDANMQIDIYAKTASGKRVVGTTKYFDSKVKKSELSSLQSRCKQAKIEADTFVIVAKKGFSSELKKLKSESVKLLSANSFSKLL
jgi:AAA+ ATPase superfamily predicted ATPase